METIKYFGHGATTLSIMTLNRALLYDCRIFIVVLSVVILSAIILVSLC
jgi:hypothetical protein